MRTIQLKPGLKISFYGTVYTIYKVHDIDIIEVILNNDIKITLWFPDLPGREIITP